MASIPTATTGVNAGEEWRPIPGFEDFYEVSNLGRVRSLDREFVRSDGRLFRTRSRILRGARHHGGAIVVTLRDPNQSLKVTHIVPRLVALAFLPPPKVGQGFVTHRDGDLDNNAACNLAWRKHGRDPRTGYHHPIRRHGEATNAAA